MCVSNKVIAILELQPCECTGPFFRGAEVKIDFVMPEGLI